MANPFSGSSDVMAFIPRDIFVEQSERILWIKACPQHHWKAKVHPDSSYYTSAKCFTGNISHLFSSISFNGAREDTMWQVIKNRFCFWWIHTFIQTGIYRWSNSPAAPSFRYNDFSNNLSWCPVWKLEILKRLVQLYTINIVLSMVRPVVKDMEQRIRAGYQSMASPIDHQSPAGSVVVGPDDSQ